MIRTFELVHFEAPNSLNAGGAGARTNWRAAYAEKIRWQNIFTMLLFGGKVPKGMTRCEISVVVRWKTKTRRDSTNYIAPIIKPLADVLAPPSHVYVKRGEKRVSVPNTAPRWLPDDTDEYLTFSGLKFEYPKPWPHKHPDVKAEMRIKLAATYPD